MVRVVGFGSLGPQFKSRSAVELIPGGVNATCPEVVKMSISLLVSCIGVATHPGLCPIAQETAEAAPTLHTEYGPNGGMDGIDSACHPSEVGKMSASMLVSCVGVVTIQDCAQ